MTTPNKITSYLAEIDALMREATPGPWSAAPRRLTIDTAYGKVDGPVMSYLVGGRHTGPGYTVSIASERHADHHLIAALRNTYPALKAEIERLTQRADRFESSLRSFDQKLADHLAGKP